MAGAEERPGDSTPATFMKFLTFEFIIKSPVSPAARSPQNEVIVLLNGIPFTYNHHEYFLTEIDRLSCYASYDKKIKVKQLTGDNIGAEYTIEQIHHDRNGRKYNVYDYKGNVKQMNLGSSVDFSYSVQKLNELATMLNNARVETEYMFENRKIESERAKNNLFGV